MTSNLKAPAPHVPRYERATETARYYKIARSTLWHWAKTRHDFPKPVKAGERVTLFDLNAIDEWLRQQREAA